MEEVCNEVQLEMIDAEKAAIVKQFMMKVTVPIFCQTSSGADHIATGTLFEISDRHFLVTARHIFDKQDPGTFSIPYNPTRSKLNTLGRLILHTPDHDAIDVAVLELQEDRTIDAIKVGWRSLTTRNAAVASPTGIFLLCGYPSQWMSSTKQTLSGCFVMVYTTRLAEVPPEAAEPINDRLDLFLCHADRGVNFRGDPSSVPELGGTSGASVWQYHESRSQAVWSPESSLRIVGVQSSVFKNRFIRAKSWEFVVAVLSKIEPPIWPR